MQSAIKMMKELRTAKKLDLQQLANNSTTNRSGISNDSEEEPPNLLKILKVMLESFEAVTEVSMPSMIVVVPSDLTDNQARSMNIEAGMYIKMESEQTALETYDIQNELYPAKIHTEILTTGFNQECKFTKLSLYLSESKVDDEFYRSQDEKSPGLRSKNRGSSESLSRGNMRGSVLKRRLTKHLSSKR